MRDVQTRKITTSDSGAGMGDWLRGWQATLVIVGGGAEGSDFVLDRESVSLGRGPDVDWAFEDEAMSRQHVAIEFAGDGFRVRDLGSTNGIRVNDKPVDAADLENGDRLQLGEHVFQVVLEKRERAPRTYLLPDDDD